jgi:hypothetical protein
MRIDGLQSEKMANGARRISARLVYEEGALEQRLYFEADEPGADVIEPSVDAFVSAAYCSALCRGERRIRVDGSVSPRVRNGLDALGFFFGETMGRHKYLPIEPTAGLEPRRRLPTAGTGCFFSGGVDSLALLRGNRVDYPLCHAWSVRDAILLFGLNNYDYGPDGEPDPDRVRGFERVSGVFRGFLASIGCRLQTVRTNIRSLYPDPGAWGKFGYVTGTTAVAHAFPTRIARALYASGGTGKLRPASERHIAYASLISSEASEVHTTQLLHTRFEKLSMLVEWPEALRILKACYWREIPAESLNCGRCEKCIRTMLGLLALGGLRDATSFPRDDLSPEDLGRVRSVEGLYLPDLVQPLRVRGRSDLANPLSRRLAHLKLRQRARTALRFKPQH